MGFIQWESIVLAIIGFALLYWLLQKFAFGPLFSVMEQRRERVVGELEKAENDRKQAEQYLLEQQQAVQSAREEAMQIIEHARQTSSRQADEMIAQAREEAARLKEEALKDIENEKNKAIAQLKSQVSAMSIMIASKIIEKQVDEQTHKDLIDQYLKEVGSKS